jgi:hypothetical protein
MASAVPPKTPTRLHLQPLIGGRGRVVGVNAVGIEKLFPAKFAKIKSGQDAPQTTFSVFPDIFYPPNSCCFEENGVFQHPTPVYANYSDCGG